jgi:outer membrane protein insertion porin family
MKNQVNWRRLSLAILASMALASPVYASEEVTRSQDINLSSHKTTAGASQGVGTIQVNTEAVKPAATTATAETAEQATDETPRYREVRRNGVTIHRKGRQETAGKEKKKAEADEEQLEARMTQQKEIQEAESKQLPGRSVLQQSVLPDTDITYPRKNSMKPFPGRRSLRGTDCHQVTLVGASHEDVGKLADVLKMPAGTKFTKEGLQDDIRARVRNRLVL